MAHTKSEGRNLIVVAGPTGIGKTATCIKLCEIFGCQIISADSRQIYKEMSIGTAKPSPQEILKHDIKLVDHISIFEDYNVSHYERDALSLIEEEFKSKQTTVLSGGTGLYIQSVCKGLNEFPKVSEEIIEQYNELFKNEGLKKLQSELKAKDLDYYNSVDIQNSRRLIRALSVIKASGNKFTYYLNQELPKRNFNVINIILNIDRKKLYERIDNRVLDMIENGLVEEARNLFEYRNLKSLQTVGYQELFLHFDGQLSLSESIEKIQMHSRRYAKRQITWLNKYIDGERFDPSNTEAIIQYIKSQIQ